MAREIAARLALRRPRRDAAARRGPGGVLASVPYRDGADDLDLDPTLERLAGRTFPTGDDIVVRDRVATARSVVLLVDVSESMVAMPARGLTNVAFPLQVAGRELARIPARDARVVLLSDCVHNAGPDPRPFAARLPRLDVLLDTTGEQDRWLGGELARLGRGKLRVAGTYRDVAPDLSSFFDSTAN
jgi:Mg-chelatase subunit ChlD